MRWQTNSSACVRQFATKLPGRLVRYFSPSSMASQQQGKQSHHPPPKGKQSFNYRSRSHLTEMLWRDRYAHGSVGNTQHNPTHDQPMSPDGLQSLYNPQPKRMLDSFCEVILPFRTDLDLREDYINHFRGLRFGKILEDLDALAGTIAMQHCRDTVSGRMPLKIVTASVDRIDLLNSLRPDLDLKLCGNVTYTGRSSMEITIKVESLGDPRSSLPIDTSGLPAADEADLDWTPICLCKFTMVARDFTSNHAAVINQLVTANDMERELVAMGERRKHAKLDMMKRDLRKSPPSPEERIIIHELWLETQRHVDSQGNPNSKHESSNICFPEETEQDLVRIMHPQERNVHSSIFGGYLMREAFELAYTTAMLFLKGRPFTVALDDISFARPVPIGSILFLAAEVVYAEGEPHRTFQVKVTAEVSQDYQYSTRQLTNTFYITFARAEVESDGKSLTVDRILPLSYTEAMEYLLAQRRKEHGIKFKDAQLQEFKMYQLESNSKDE
eukprot:Partr_v1_DN27464_c1_g1_i1_m71554 putative Acyl-CoA thioesterase